MALSKEKLTIPGAAAEVPRQPKCTRCRHHGIVVPQKGHMKLCPFLKCACWRCFLITERTRITALQRNLRRAEENKLRNNEKRPSDSVRRRAAPAAPEAPEACGASAAAGAASHLSDVTRTPEKLVTIARSPLDVRRGPAAGGERVAGSDPTDVLTFPEKPGNCPPCSPHNFGELRAPALLPFIHFPFRMSAHYPSRHPLCPDFINMPWLTPVCAGPYSCGLDGPLQFPHFQQGAVHFPPPPEPRPPAEHKPVFFTLQPPSNPEACPEQLVSRQHPQPPLAKHADPDIVELD